MRFLQSHRFTPLRAKLLYDKEGKSRGTGFVQMNSPQEAHQVIESLNGAQFEGRPMNIDMANYKN